jgi:hypothetical protein
MGQTLLVEKQIADGQVFVERLVRDGFEVTAACWAKTTDDSRWYLYLASPAVDKAGLGKTYRVVSALIQEMEQEGFWIDLFDIKLLSPADPFAVAVANLCRRYPGKTPRPYGDTLLGGVSIDGAYIYPAIPVQVQ